MHGRYGIRGLTVSCLVLCTTMARAQQPTWWSNVIDSATMPCDYAPAVLGQLKWVATNAAEELENYLPGGAGSTVHTLVSGFSSTNNWQPVNVGQLKETAEPFWYRLKVEHYATNYPWTETTTDDTDSAIANLGQLKQVFCFDLGSDTDADGLPDWWEDYWFGSPTNQSASGDADGDSLLNSNEFAIGTSPAASDTDGDSYRDEYEIGRLSDPLVSTSFPRSSIGGTVSYVGAQTGLIHVVVASSNSWSTDFSHAISAPGAYVVTNVPDLSNYWVRAYRDCDADLSNDFWEAQGEYAGNSLCPSGDVVGINFALADPDTDSDGLPDWWEMEYFEALGSGPTNDPDGDALSNAAELTEGTDPMNPDTDSDLLTDGAEVQRYSTDPTQEDSDGDGTPDSLDKLAGFYDTTDWAMRITTIPSQFTLHGVSTGHFYEFLWTRSLLSPQIWLMAETGFRGEVSGYVEWNTWNVGPGRQGSSLFFIGGIGDDTDGDLISDIYEIVVLDTYPDHPDTDQDGVTDGNEDFDFDGLTNAEEYNSPTNTGYRPYAGSSSPWDTDTDGDGVCDGPTVPPPYALSAGPDAFPLDPSAWLDTDDDGFPDELHGQSNSNPPLTADPDADGDEMLDSWEQQIVDADLNDSITDIADVLPGDDFDGDGLLNLTEFNMGLDPTDLDSDGDGVPDSVEIDLLSQSDAFVGLSPTVSNSYGPLEIAAILKLPAIEVHLTAADFDELYLNQSDGLTNTPGSITGVLTSSGIVAVASNTTYLAPLSLGGSPCFGNQYHQYTSLGLYTNAATPFLRVVMDHYHADPDMPLSNSYATVALSGAKLVEVAGWTNNLDSWENAAESQTNTTTNSSVTWSCDFGYTNHSDDVEDDYSDGGWGYRDLTFESLLPTLSLSTNYLRLPAGPTNAVISTVFSPAALQPADPVSIWWTISPAHSNGLHIAGVTNYPYHGSNTLTLIAGDLGESYTITAHPYGLSSIAATATVDIIKVDLEELAFTNNHTVISDDSNTVYEAAHWQDPNRDGDPSDGRCYPLCFTRDTKMTVSGKWYLQSSAPGIALKIKGDGPGNLDFPATSASISGNEVTITNVECETAFANEIDYMDPMTIEWKFSFDDGTTWCDAGTSTNQTYVTLGDPSTNVTLFHTVVHIGCKSGDGESDTDDAVDAIWSDFTDCIVKRVDGETLYYYSNAVPTSCATDLPGLLTTADGQCQAWAYFFEATLLAQGIDDAVVYVCSTDTVALWDSDDEDPPVTNKLFELTSATTDGGFLVKHWSLLNPSWDNDANHNWINDDIESEFPDVIDNWESGEIGVVGEYEDFDMPYSDVLASGSYEGTSDITTTGTGLKGQGDIVPSVQMFPQHLFVVRGNPTMQPPEAYKLYDPSYGAKYEGADAVEQWVNSSLDGFYYLWGPPTNLQFYAGRIDTNCLIKVHMAPEDNLWGVEL